MEPEEEFLERMDNIELIKTVKAKRTPSPAQLQHLDNIRGKALQKKKEMKEISEKAKLGKELDDKKALKKQEKELLCQKYENHIKEKLKQEEQPVNPTKTDDVPEIVVDFDNNKKVNNPVDKPKHKKKVVKREIVYEEESCSSTEEQVVVTKSKPRKLKSEPPPPVPVVEPPRQLTYNELILESSLGRIKNRISEERSKTLLHSVIPTYY
jgi:hypothetical protein